LRGVVVPLAEEQHEADWSRIIADSGAKVVIAGNKDLYAHAQTLRGVPAEVDGKAKSQPAPEAGPEGEAARAELKIKWAGVEHVVLVDSTEGYQRYEDNALSEILRKLRIDQRDKERSTHMPELGRC
ncbi:hypothetical protein T484DRAFT_1796246, partial [Baffinella frigidus]